MSDWIKFKDEFPPEDGRYLVYVPNWNWVGVSSLRQGMIDDVAATHWMYLPKPPEGKKK